MVLANDVSQVDLSAGISDSMLTLARGVEPDLLRILALIDLAASFSIPAELSRAMVSIQDPFV